MNCAAKDKLRVMVVDDGEDYVEAVSNLLTTFPCTGSVDQALSAYEALQKIDRLRPDLMLIDIAMPGTNGLDLTRAVKALPNSPKVIIVTLYDTPAYRAAAQIAGAEGFVGKSDLGIELQAIINRLFPNTFVSTAG